MPQPEVPAARSGAIQGAAYSESASNGAPMPTPARSLISRTRILHQPARRRPEHPVVPLRSPLGHRRDLHDHPEETHDLAVGVVAERFGRLASWPATSDGVVIPQLSGSTVVILCPFRISHHLTNYASVVVGGSAFRVAFDRGVEVTHRQVKLPTEEAGVAPAAVRDLIGGVHSQGDVEVGHRPSIVPFGAIGVSPEPVGESIFGVEPQCGVVVGNRPVQLALHAEGGSATAIGKRAFWVELERAVEVPNRPVVLLLVAIAITPRSVGVSMVRSEASDLVQIGESRGRARSALHGRGPGSSEPLRCRD